VVEPSRSKGGQRLYSDRDIERLVLLKRVTDAGRSIGKVAELEMEALEALAEEDAAARRKVERWEARAVGGSAAPDAGALLESAMESVESLDADGLEATLKRAAVTLGAAAFTDDLVVPLLRRIGERWIEGSLRPAHEHAATAVIQRVLTWMSEPAAADPGGPSIVVATLPGESHDLGAMLASATASLGGWKVTYLGKDLPAEDIAAAANALEARLVGVSTVNPRDPDEVVAALRDLREGLRDGTRVVVGGAAAGEAVSDIGMDGVQIVASLDEFRKVLAEAYDAPAD
jgi:methanogenic corrinoid protein MtbC1